MKLTRLIVAQVLVLFCLACSLKENQKYQLVTHNLLSIGQDQGDPNYIFGQINDVCLDDEGNIYVLDFKKIAVTKFDKNGFFKLSLAHEGQGPGELQMTRAIASYQNKICVLDFFKVSLFQNDGRYLSSIPIDCQGIDIAFNEKGQIVVLGAGKEGIFYVYDTDGKFQYSYGHSFEVPEKLSKFKEMKLFQLPLKMFINGDRTLAMNPHRYEVVIWRNSAVEKTLGRKEPEFFEALIKEEGGGFSGIVGQSFIWEKGDLIYVFYTRKGGKYGLDLWLKNKLQASFEVDNIPYEADKDGNFYMVGNREVSKVIKCHIDILSPKGKPPVWQR